MKKRREKKFALKIKDKGRDIYDLKGITKAFHDFYVKLFEAKKTDMTKLNEYFQKCGLAKIPEEKRKE